MNTHRASQSDERGVAMVLALVAIIIVGGLVAATFGPSMLEQRIAENARRAEMSFQTAEYGLGEIMGGWQTWDAYQLRLFQTKSVAGSLSTGGGVYSGTIRRVGDFIFMIEVTGTTGGNQAQQHVAQFWQLTPVQPDIRAALTTQGPTGIGGSAALSGNDQQPAGWSGCPGGTGNLSGIRTRNMSDVQTQGACSSGNCISGNPPVTADSSIDSTTFFNYGDLHWNDLVALANKRIAPATYRIQPVASGTQCVTSRVDNWGDPVNQASPCTNYFPIVYATGDLSIQGNLGQGLLLVEGDLTVDGNFQFYGVVIVRGRLVTQGTGGHFNGAVLAADANLNQNTILGNAAVQYSSCAVWKALVYAAPGAPIRSRGWMNASK